MLQALLFLLLWGANFVWLVIVVGGLIVKVMARTKKREQVIIGVTAVLSLLLTLWVIDRGPEFDDSIMTSCMDMQDGCY